MTLRDSGSRKTFESGAVREPDDGKPRFDLMVPLDVPYEDQMLTRFAVQMAKGVDKYSDRNWEKGNSPEEMARYKASAFRHFMQWLTDETDEDHAAALMFNIMSYETLKYKSQKS